MVTVIVLLDSNIREMGAVIRPTVAGPDVVLVIGEAAEQPPDLSHAMT